MAASNDYLPSLYYWPVYYFYWPRTYLYWPLGSILEGDRERLFIVCNEYRELEVEEEERIIDANDLEDNNRLFTIHTEDRSICVEEETRTIIIEKPKGKA